MEQLAHGLVNDAKMCNSDQCDDDLTTLDGRRYVIAVDANNPDLPGKIRYVGVAYFPGSKRPITDPAIRMVYVPQMVCPRPSHGELCLACNKPTSGLAQEMKCGHTICWTCNLAWREASRQDGMCHSCLLCEETEDLNSNYYQGPNELTSLVMAHSKGWAYCAITSVNEPPHLKLLEAPIIVIHDVLENTWIDAFQNSEYGQQFVKSMLEITQWNMVNNRTIDQILRNTTNMCQWCGEMRPKARCSKCKVATYCNHECQRKHWKLHKRTCTTHKNTETQETSKLDAFEDCMATEMEMCRLRPNDSLGLRNRP